VLKDLCELELNIGLHTETRFFCSDPPPSLLLLMPSKWKFYTSTPLMVRTTFFFVMKIPGVPENNTFLSEVFSFPEDETSLVLNGLGQFVMWCSIIGIHVHSFYYPAGVCDMSLAFGTWTPDKAE
jgi:hypothetical protein